MANYGKTNLPPRTCACGCGREFKPKTETRLFFSSTCKANYHYAKNPEKKYKKKPKRMELTICLRKLLSIIDGNGLTSVLKTEFEKETIFQARQLSQSTDA